MGQTTPRPSASRPRGLWRQSPPSCPTLFICPAHIPPISPVLTASSPPFRLPLDSQIAETPETFLLLPPLTHCQPSIQLICEHLHVTAPQMAPLLGFIKTLKLKISQKGPSIQLSSHSSGQLSQLTLHGPEGPHSCRCSSLPLRPGEALSQHVLPRYCSNSDSEHAPLLKAARLPRHFLVIKPFLKLCKNPSSLLLHSTRHLSPCFSLRISEAEHQLPRRQHQCPEHPRPCRSHFIHGTSEALDGTT